MRAGRRTGRSLVLLVLLAGCGPTEPAKPTEPPGMWSGTVVKERHRDATPKPAPGDARTWPSTLSEAERERCTAAAWTAVRTPEVWSTWFESPESADELPLTADGLRCDPLPPDFATVLVAIPSGGRVGWHPTYIGVTLDRGRCEVLAMCSSFWP